MSDPRLAQLYADVDELARLLRGVAEEHVRLTPPEDELAFFLIVGHPGGFTPLHTFRQPNGQPDNQAAVDALLAVAIKLRGSARGIDLTDGQVSDAVSKIAERWDRRS